MNKVTKLLAAAALAFAATPASAVWISAGGGSINISGGLHVEIASVFENVVTQEGDILRGVGEISLINGVATSSLCSSDCELTFRFDNYVVTSIDSGVATFSGGTFDVYLAFGAENDFNPFESASSAADLAAATNGGLFLTLEGHDIDSMGNTLISIALPGNDLLGTEFAFFGSGQLDVRAGAGAANDNFDTNSINSAFGGNADMSFTTSGNTLGEPHEAECQPSPGFGPECIVGSADIRGFVIPEPGTLALLGLALSGLGFIRRRRRQS